MLRVEAAILKEKARGTLYRRRSTKRELDYIDIDKTL